MIQAFAPDFSTPDLPLMPVQDPVGMLVGDVEAVRRGGVIRLLCAEANPAVYNDPRVLEALSLAKRRRDAVILVSAGPLLVVDHSGTNGLLAASARGIVDRLAFRLARGHSAHFRVVETAGGLRLYAEPPHRPLAPLDQRRAVDFANLDPHRRDDFARRARSSFDRSLERAAHVYRSDSPETGLPLLTTEDGLLSLIDAARRRGLDPDALGPLELQTLARGSAAVWRCDSRHVVTPPDPAAPGRSERPHDWTGVAPRVAARHASTVSVDEAIAAHVGDWVLMCVSAFDHYRNPSSGHVIAHAPDDAPLWQKLSDLAAANPHARYYVFSAYPRLHSSQDLALELAQSDTTEDVSDWRNW